MYYFIVNPRSSRGRGLRIWKKVLRYLNKIDRATNYEVFITDKRGDAREFSKRLTEKSREPKTITVIGGDGTLNEVVDGSNLNNGNVSIAFFPSRTDNDFFRSTRRGYNLKQQLRRIFNTDEEQLFDYGVLNSPSGNRRFVVSAGIGFDAAMLHDVLLEQTSMQQILLSRRLSYLLAFFRELRRAEQTQGSVVLDGERRFEFNNIIFISAHVHPYEGGYKLGPTANGSDGYLDLVVVSTRHKSRVVGIMLSSLTGSHQNMTGVHVYRCRTAEIHTKRPMPVHTDGEIVGTLNELVLNCVPRKLRVRV